MIRPFPRIDREARRRARREAAHEWRRRFVPLAVLNVDGHGRCIVVMRLLETRMSVRHARRLWRMPV